MAGSWNRYYDQRRRALARAARGLRIRIVVRHCLPIFLYCSDERRVRPKDYLACCEGRCCELDKLRGRSFWVSRTECLQYKHLLSLDTQMDDHIPSWYLRLQAEHALVDILVVRQGRKPQLAYNLLIMP